VDELPGPGMVLWYDVSPFDIYQLNFAPSYHLIPVHLLHSAIMAGYYSMHLFPVSASSISFHRCYCTCILSCGCVGLLVRRYCCEFLVCCHCKIGYRILNCIMNLWSFICGFYLSLGIPQLLFKVIFVAVILSTHSSLVFVCAGCYCARFLFVGMVQQTLRKLGRCQMTQLL